MSSFTTPLDLKTIFVTYFAGGMDVFMFIMVILISGMAARYNMPNQVFIMLFILFSIMMAGVGYGLFLIIGLFTVGLFSYWALAKFGKT